jgi:SAM-dependent methyltransferase
MAYRFMSPHATDEHNVDQWTDRSLEGELRSYEDRTIVGLFDKYLTGDARVMEGGCGFGGWCEWFRRRGISVVGIEFNENVVRRAKELGPTVPVVLGDVAKLDYPGDSFDAYISLGVVEHFEDGPGRALQEARRVVRPGGLIFVSTPYLNLGRRLVAHPVRGLYLFVRKLRRKPSYFWEYRFTKEELTRYVEAAGFDVVEVGLDDYEPWVTNRHIGLWADWFFLRAREGEIWELNFAGVALLRILGVLPRAWYSSGVVVVARA